MRWSLAFIVSMSLAGSAYAQGSAAVFTPTERDLSVPTYINATVVKVDSRNRTVRFRSASGEVSLAVDQSAVRDLGRLRPGDEVILGYEIDNRSGRAVQVVTAIHAGRDSGAAVSTVAATPSSFSTVTGRVVSADPAAGTLVLADALGRTETVSVQGSVALGVLGGVAPGQQVSVGFVPGAALGGALGGVGGVFGTVNSIQPTVNPTFVTGSIVSVDPRTGMAVLRTPFGDQAFTAPSGVNVSTLRQGDNVRLTLGRGGNERMFTNVTPLGQATAPLGATFATPTVIGSTGFSGAATVPTTTFNMPAPGRTTVGSASVPSVVGTAPGGVLVPGATGVVPGAAAVPPTTGNFAGVVPSSVAGVSGRPTTGATFSSPLSGQVNAGVGGVGGPGVNPATGFVGGGLNTANVGLSSGTLSFPASPFAQVIPSLPSVTGQLNVVPPPQMAPALPDALPVGAARDFATRDYDYAVQALALKANEIDAHWFRYRDGCLRSSSLNPDIDRNLHSSNRDREWYGLFSGDVRTPADDNCRQLVIEMTRMAADWRNNMARVEDTARANDVLPGAMREIRQRYRVDF